MYKVTLELLGMLPEEYEVFSWETEEVDNA